MIYEIRRGRKGREILRIIGAPELRFIDWPSVLLVAARVPRKTREVDFEALRVLALGVVPGMSLAAQEEAPGREYHSALGGRR